MTTNPTTQREADERDPFEIACRALEYYADPRTSAPGATARDALALIAQARAAIDQSARKAAPEAPAAGDKLYLAPQAATTASASGENRVPDGFINDLAVRLLGAPSTTELRKLVRDCIAEHGRAPAPSQSAPQGELIDAVNMSGRTESGSLVLDYHTEMAIRAALARAPLPGQVETPAIEFAPDADDESCARRLKNFSIRAEPAREPDFVGEKSILVTYNGRQEYTAALAPHEARKFYDLLAVEYGFATPVQAADVARDAARLDKMIDWYLRDGKRMEIDPFGYIRQTERAHILRWLDGGSNADPEKDVTRTNTTGGSDE